MRHGDSRKRLILGLNVARFDPIQQCQILIYYASMPLFGVVIEIIEM
jgi:hypothetical protein